jgi:hypothetical protein
MNNDKKKKTYDADVALWNYISHSCYHDKIEKNYFKRIFSLILMKCPIAVLFTIAPLTTGICF